MTSWTTCAGCPPSVGCGRATRWSLLVHASPGSQTAGLARSRPATTVQRVTRSDARVICAATPTSRMSVSWVASSSSTRGPAASRSTATRAAGWALVHARWEAPAAELHRVTYDAQTVAEEVGARGLGG